MKAGWAPIIPQVTKFATEQGRMKFVRPLYRELFKVISDLYALSHLSQMPGGADVAKSTFLEHRSQYHAIASSLIAKDLGV